MKTRQIVFTKTNVVEMLEEEIPKLGDNEVLVETAFSAVSSGTERANITGDTNVSIYEPENTPAKFPRYGGYSSSGTVIEKGCNVTSVDVGDRVVMSWSKHSKYNVLGEGHVTKIKDDRVSMKAAAICHIGTFSMAAIRKTGLEAGESMMVMGLGILGLLAVQFAKAAGGVPVIAVDPIASKREKALEFGADYALDPTSPDFVSKVKELTEGGVHTVVEVTGLGVGLNQSLDCVRKFGRIALLGCTRDKNFTVDYYRKIHGPGITIVGAHTLARPKMDNFKGWFTQKEDISTILRLEAFGRIKLDKFVDEVFSPDDYKEVFDRLVNDKEFPPIVEFDWSIN